MWAGVDRTLLGSVWSSVSATLSSCRLTGGRSMNEVTRFRFPQPDDVFQLGVRLVDSEPSIWRRLLVEQHVLLPQLHRILQAAMGWTDSHLHQFLVGDLQFGEPDDEFSPGPIDYRHISVNQVLSRPGAVLLYEYDFGDSWGHLIELEERLDSESVSGPLPRCVDGARACPPEDCGGIHGYERLLETIGDPRDPEHDQYASWLGTGFDPEAFDLDTVNERLARTAASGKRRE